MSSLSASFCFAQAGERSADLVCRKWLETQNETATNRFEKKPQGQCDEGIISKSLHQDALNRTNLYRWFAGLGPVSVNWDIQPKIQKTAFLMAINRKLSHQPKENENWQCWSEDAATGARLSLLGHESFSAPKVNQDGTIQLVDNYDALSTAADNVDGYIKDNGPLIASHVLHRHAVLAPGLTSVAFGQFDNFNAMYVDIANGVIAKKPSVYPFSGPSPYDMFKNFPWWTFSHPNESLLKGNAQMTITDLETKEQRVIAGRVASLDTLAFQGPDYGEFGFLKWGLKPETVFIKANHKYQVEVATDKCKWKYLITPIQCKVEGNSTDSISTEITEECR